MFRVCRTKSGTVQQAATATTQRNASSFARSRRRRTHNSAVLRAYGAGGDGETSGAIHASESIGNQEPFRHEPSLGQAAEDKAAEGMPSSAIQVCGLGVVTVTFKTTPNHTPIHPHPQSHLSITHAHAIPTPYTYPSHLPFRVRNPARRRAQRLDLLVQASNSMQRSSG